MRNLQTLGENDILLYRTHRSTLPDDELSATPVETDLEKALAHEPHAVIIANPTSLHLDVAIPAAELGCHILMEKPISHSMDRIDILKKALQTGGGQMLVGFQFRFHPCIQQVSRWIQEGEIGKPLSARAHYGDYLPGWHPWEDYRKSYSALPDLGGGAITTLCHPLDYLRWLMGEVESVWALSGKISDLEIEVDDAAEIGLQFAGGAFGSAHLDYFQQPPTYRFEIIGTAGTILWDQVDNTARLYNASNREWVTFAPPPAFERNDLFLEEMRHFLDIARGDAEPLCTLDDGIRVLQIVLAAYESSRIGAQVKL